MTTVEFCGIPGAGKSTWCARLADDLRAHGHVVHLPRARIDTEVSAPLRIARKSLLALAALNPAAVRAAIRIARAQERTADRAGRALQWLITQRFLARPAPGLTLLDEGLVQALWSAAWRGDPAEVLALEPAAGPDLVIVVEAEPGVAAARLVARGSEHSRVQRSDDVTSALVRSAALLDEILERLPTIAPGTTVRRVRDGDDVAVARAWMA